MASLYVDRRGVSLSLDSDAIVFHEGDARIATVPLGPLERVYLRGDVRLSAGLVGRLGARGVGLVVLSGRRAVPTMLLPRPHNDARLRVAQIRASGDPAVALGVARRLIAGKIAAQHDLLVEIRAARPDLAGALLAPVEALGRMRGHANQKPTLDALRGLEGAAAAAFFQGYVQAFPESVGFTGRNRRPPRDPVNAALSLAYTLLHAEAVLAAHGHGFDPWVGYVHALDFGRESLACDLVEPLRPIVDRFVWRLFAGQTLRARDFSTEKDGACLLQKAGRERFYAEIETIMPDIRRRLDAMLQALRRMLLGDDEVEPDAAALPDQL
ncbi:MAG: CRISPR-associated endonuclease Cas1 [Sphingomonadaceae bacterium]